MNRYDMQDLIIEEDNSSGGKKPKRVLAIVALVIIILIVGMTIMRSVVSSDDENGSKKKPTQTQSVDKELQPVNNPIKVRSRESDDAPDELKPINDDELPTIPLPAPKVEDTKEQTKAPEPEENREDKKPTHVESVKPKEHKKPVIKKESTPHKTQKPKSVKRVSKESSKPSELFKKQKSVNKHSSSGKIYYIQIGSFSKTPEHKYFENIKSKGYNYKLFRSGNLIKVRVGPYRSYEEAKSKLPQIQSTLGVSGFVVKVK